MQHKGKQWGKCRKNSALAICTESIRAVHRPGPSWISYRWAQVHSPFYTLQWNIYYRTYTIAGKLYSIISYLVCSVLCSRMLNLTLERLAWHHLPAEWVSRRQSQSSDGLPWITYFQHTHTHTLTAVRGPRFWQTSRLHSWQTHWVEQTLHLREYTRWQPWEERGGEGG